MPDHAADDCLGFALLHTSLDDHIARQHHAHEAGVIAQHVEAVANELIDVTVIVGQQNPGLHVAPVTAGVMHQPAQGEIHPRAVEQGQRVRVGVFPVVQAIGNIIGRGGQIGAGEYPRQLRGRHAAASELVALFDDIGIGNVAGADADFHLHAEVMHQRL